MDNRGRLCLLLLLVVGCALGVGRALWPAPRLEPSVAERFCPVAIERAGAGVLCVAVPPAGVSPGDIVDERGRVVGRMAPARLALFAVPLDVNRASAAELMSLDGIGAQLAERLIAARPFERMEDLLNVTGLGKKRYRTLEHRLFVRATD